MDLLIVLLNLVWRHWLLAGLCYLGYTRCLWALKCLLRHVAGTTPETMNIARTNLARVTVDAHTLPVLVPYQKLP